MNTLRFIAVLTLLVALLTGCGSEDGVADGSTTATTSTTSTTAATSTTAVEPTTLTTTSSSTGTTGSTTTTWGGEPIVIGPVDGDVIAVVGVEFDDVLNIRADPGVGAPVVATAGPLTDDLVATGMAWRLTGSIWFEVTLSDTTGWVNGRYVAYLGGVDDVTSAVIAAIGSRPTADSMEELGLIVAKTQASTDPEVASRITVTVAPSIGDLGEVTYDVVGLADDSVLGSRVHVFGTPGDAGGFTLKSVESTELCLRGVSDGLLCI